MSRIKGKDTEIELRVRSFLFRQGFRFRKNVKGLPGKPDVVLPKYRTVIFIHGCFWHRHPGCKDTTTPKTRTEYWLDKFQKNMENDKANQEALIADGWKVLIIWECEINKSFEKTMKNIIEEIVKLA